MGSACDEVQQLHATIMLHAGAPHSFREEMRLYFVKVALSPAGTACRGTVFVFELDEQFC